MANLWLLSRSFVKSLVAVVAKSQFLRYKTGLTRGRGVLPNMGYIGMCGPKGYCLVSNREGLGTSL